MNSLLLMDAVTTDETSKIVGDHENKLFQIVGELRQRRETETYSSTRIQQLTEENFELKIQKKTAEQKCHQIKEEHEKLFLEQRQNYEEKISNIQQEKVKIQVRMDCLQKELEDIKNEARLMHVEKLTLEKTISELKGHIVLHSSLQNNIQEQVKQVNSLNEKLSKTCKELHMAQESLRDDVNHAISMHDKIKGINKQYFQKIQELLKEHLSTKSNVTLLRSKLQEDSVVPAQDNSFQIEELKLQVKHGHDEIVALRDILEKSRLQNRANLESLEASQKLVDEYVGLLKEISDDKEDILNELNSLKEENSNLHDQLNKMQRELDQQLSEWRLRELMKSDASDKAIQTDHLSSDRIPSVLMDSPISMQNTKKSWPEAVQDNKSFPPMKGILVEDDGKFSWFSSPHLQDCGGNDSIASNDKAVNDTHTELVKCICTYPKNTIVVEEEQLSKYALLNMAQHKLIDSDIQLCNRGINSSHLKNHSDGSENSFLLGRLDIKQKKDIRLQEKNSTCKVSKSQNNDLENKIIAYKIILTEKQQCDDNAINGGDIGPSSNKSLVHRQSSKSTLGKTGYFEIPKLFLVQQERIWSNISLYSLQEFYNDMLLPYAEKSKKMCNEVIDVLKQSTNMELTFEILCPSQAVSTVCAQSDKNEVDNSFLPNRFLLRNIVTFPLLELSVFIKQLLTYCKKTANVSNLISQKETLNSDKTVISVKRSQEGKRCGDILAVTLFKNNDNCSYAELKTDEKESPHTCHASNIQSKCESTLNTTLLLSSDKNNPTETVPSLLETIQPPIDIFHKTVPYNTSRSNSLLGSTSLASILSRNTLLETRKRPLSAFADKLWVPSFKRSNVPG